jgi:hypothetical protein
MKKKRSQRHNEALIMTVLVLLEDLDEKNPMTSKKITNNNQSMPHETSKEKWDLTHLLVKCYFAKYFM